jgi:hypothetical protein
VDVYRQHTGAWWIKHPSLQKHSRWASDPNSAVLVDDSGTVSFCFSVSYFFHEQQKSCTSLYLEKKETRYIFTITTGLRLRGCSLHIGFFLSNKPQNKKSDQEKKQTLLLLILTPTY